MLDSRGVEPASVGDRNAAGIDQDNVDMRASGRSTARLVQ